MMLDVRHKITQHAVERFEALFPQGVSPLGLQFRERRPRELLYHITPRRHSYKPRAFVMWISTPFDISALLKIADKRTHGLPGHLRQVRQFGNMQAFRAHLLEHREVCWTQISVSRLLEPLIYTLNGRLKRNAQQRANHPRPRLFMYQWKHPFLSILQVSLTI